MKKFIMIIGSIIIVCFIFFYWSEHQIKKYNALNMVDAEIKNTNYPFPCPNTNNGVWLVSGHVDINDELIYYQYTLTYDNKTNQSILNNLRINPNQYYDNICNNKKNRYIIDNTNGIIANFRGKDNPDMVSIKITKQICKNR